MSKSNEKVDGATTQKSETLSATSTEPNSKQRVANRVAGNRNDVRGGLNVDMTPDTLGSRKGATRDDLIWTNDSKDNWAGRQPPLSQLLKQREEIERQRVEREEG